jgi:hypothetical protein
LARGVIGGGGGARSGCPPPAGQALPQGVLRVITPRTEGLGAWWIHQVIPFHRGQPSPATKVGQVPAGFSPGTGTIVTGTAANKAKAAAQAAYPGGTVNRVVRLSNGEYNVHVIGVNWPHHVFVNQSFKVVGAE